MQCITADSADSRHLELEDKAAASIGRKLQLLWKWHKQTYPMLPGSEGFLSYMAPVCWNHLASDDKYDSDGEGDSDVVLYMGVS